MKLSYLILVLALGYGAFYLSGVGVLVGSDRTNILDENGPKLLHCHYFVAVETVEKTYIYSKNDIIGRAFCPRILTSGEF